MAQGSSSAMLVVLGTVAVLLLSCCPGATAETFNVGGADQKWEFPPNNDTGFYTAWAANQTFKVFDVIQFVYNNTSHNVLPMPSNSCNISLGTRAPFTDGFTNITFMTAGTKYYICSFPRHCDLGGMKLQLEVTADVTSTSAIGSPASAPGPSSAAAPRQALVIGFGAVAAATGLLAASFFL